jgi:hypothetical protein
MLTAPILTKQRELDDDGLRQMLLAAQAIGNTTYFFEQFAYQGEPHATLAHGQSLLAKCKSLEPDIYKTLHKGTPFYWLAIAAFLVNDYETAAFYIDAAVSEDLRVEPANGTTPALLFFKIDDSTPNQAARVLVTLLKTRIEELVRIYNARNGACKPDLAFDEIRTSFLQPAALVGNEHLRTLVTTFISFFLEWDHRYGLIGMRPEKGTAEPFFMHLFKGCLLFESLLKTSKAQPKQTALLGVLNELQGPLLLQKQIQGVQTTFPAVVQSLSADDGSVYSAIDLTYRLRNTTAHSLGWQVALGQKAYKGLVECIAVACLHALGCLYR